MSAGLETPVLELPHPSFPDDGEALAGPEFTGWSVDAAACGPKIAALASLANLAPPDPVGRVQYHSRGNALVISGVHPERARASAAALEGLQVTLIGPGEAAAREGFVEWSGEVASIEGWLGDFTATFRGLRTPGDAAPRTPVQAKFDLVLDFSLHPAFAMRMTPQGYYRGTGDAHALAAVHDEMRSAVGEFEKPKFFAYRENLCAHKRSEVTGCTKCLHACATAAIRSEGDKVTVEPHLCMGCGTCTAVCPSGAMGFQFPRLADRGAQLKQLLSTYRHRGGESAAIVFHDAGGRALLERALAEGRGLPPRALPLEQWSVGPTGLDVLLPAIAFGASQVVVLATPEQDREDLATLREQMAIGEAILAALGYGGTHFTVVEAEDGAGLEAAFAALAPAQAPTTPATFLPGNDKRTAIEFAVEHLATHAPAPVDEIALPAGAPWGEVKVDRDKCTMCMACVGACPASALMDGVDVPLIRFLERNCVQCGLCEATCPEDAIELSPRLLLDPAAREARVLNETQPFHCVRCQKAFGTKQMVAAMMSRLSGHSMFAGADALKRLQMCADCRVVDMMEAKQEVSVLRLGGDA